MAVWVWVESPGTAVEDEPRVRSSRFGDGYEQRAPDGLNPLAQSWPLVFSGVDNAVADDMVAFLRAHGGAEAFDYTPLWETQPVRVICRKWRRTHSATWGESDLSATFERVYEP